MKRNKEHFGRDLKAVARIRKQRPREAGGRTHVYVGIEVRTGSDE